MSRRPLHENSSGDKSQVQGTKNTSYNNAAEHDSTLSEEEEIQRYYDEKNVRDRFRGKTRQPDGIFANNNTLKANSTSNDFKNESYSPGGTTSSSLNIYFILFVVFSVFCCIGYGYFWLFLKPMALKNCSYRDLQKEFPKEDEEMWRSLSITIENILNEKTEQSGVYLFMHTNKKYLREFVKTLAKESSNCYGNTMEPIEIGEEGFNDVEDYGRIVETFKNNLKKSQVILIANLNEIPAKSALALHDICDTYSPIDKKAIIYLTLVPSIVREKPTATARDTLMSLWGPKLEKNKLEPIITRVTDMVIQLKG